MTRALARRTRGGFSLAEMMVSLVIVAIIGAALTRLMVDQMRQFDRQIVQRDARAVSRGAVNLVLSELRMAESNAVTAADDSTITLLVPYAMGIVCGSSGSATTVSLLPMDSTAFADADFGGYAYRDSAGAYTYRTSGAHLAAGDQAVCAGASITTLADGAVVTVSPVVPGSVAVGFPVMLLQSITYGFRESGFVPGRRGLWRTVGGTDEELAAPFDTTARFRYYVLNADSAQLSPPASLGMVRGIELVLGAESERAAQGRGARESVRVTTAVFFRNRLD